MVNQLYLGWNTLENMVINWNKAFEGLNLDLVKIKSTAYILDKNIPPAIDEEVGRYIYDSEGGSGLC